MNDDRISEVYKGEIWAEEAQSRARRRIDWMCSEAVGDRALDIGCSQGIASIVLGREGFSVIGIDVQEDRITYALTDLEAESEATRARVDFEVGEGGDLRFDDKSFDTVLLGEVIEHLAQPGRVLTEVARVLRPGGRAVITTPFGVLHHHDHRQTFFPASLVELISVHLDIVSVTIEDRYFRVVAGFEADPLLAPAEAVRQLELAATRTVMGIQEELAALKLERLEHRRRDKAANDRNTALQKEAAALKSALTAASQRADLLAADAAQVRQVRAELETAGRQLRKVEGRAQRSEQTAKAARRQVTTMTVRLERLEVERWKLRQALATERWKLRSMRARKWWRIGALLAAAKRRPSRVLVLPFDLVSLVAGPSTKVPRPPEISHPHLQLFSGVESTPSQKPTILPSRRHAPIPRRHLVVAAILDEETSRSFSHEWHVIDLTPENWRVVFASARPEVLILDPTSEGRGRTWSGKFGHSATLSIDVAELLEAAKSAGVPRIMLAQHGPQEAGAFDGLAEYFDVAVTTDPATTAAYERMEIRCLTVPTGVQTKRYHPVASGRRLGDVVLLDDGQLPSNLGPAADASIDFRLDIHTIGSGSGLIWPSRFSESLRDEVDWGLAPDVYKGYKVALAPSGEAGPSPAILRAAATATPVVAIAGSDTSIPHLAATDEAEARTTLQFLLASEDARSRIAHQALRVAVREFPLRATADAILGAAGVPAPPHPSPHVTVMAPTNRPDRIDDILANVARQSYSAVDLVLVHHGFSPDAAQVRDAASAAGIDEITFVAADATIPAGEVFNHGFRAARGDLIAKMDDDDFYGAEYLSDQVDAFAYTDADIVGKWAHYTYLEQLDTTILRYGRHEHEYRDVLAISTLLIKRHIFESIEFPPLPVGSGSVFLREVVASGGRLYSADRFNYLYVRYAERGHHTFPVSDLHLAANAESVCRGRNLAHVLA